MSRLWTGAIPPGAVYPLALGFVLLLAPQVQRLPFWLSIVAVLGCVWGVGRQRQWWRSFPRPLRIAVMLALVAVFAVTHLGQFTVDTAASFFILTVALKWTETEQSRDVFVLFMILCYLAAVTFLFEQGIFWSLLVILAVLTLFGSLQALAAGRAAVAGILLWRRLAVTLLKVLPVVAVLFLVFPRLAPLWSVPLVSERGSAGLSESMTPGQFSDLAQSGETAFRVTFGGAPPPPGERYWRGLILDHFDGRTWARGDDTSDMRIGRVNQSRGAGELGAGEYEILMEPSFQRWAYALDRSEPVTPNVSLTAQGLVKFARPVDTTVRYRLRRTEEWQGMPMNDALRQRYTQLPVGVNPKTREWARALARQTAGEPDGALRFITAVMAHFRLQPFYYTLQPPLLGEDSVDDFLFQSRRGYCAHYASAMAFALRSVGIPTRVIGGYLGGEFGLNDEYLIVRQYDAHAWVEAWLPQRGWMRFDPTAMVAPGRVEPGWRQAMDVGEGAFAGDWAGPIGYGELPLVRWAGLRLDAVNYYWQRWVVGYQGDTQRSLFGGLPGSPDLSTLGLWTASFIALVVTFAGYRVVRRERRISPDPAVRYALRWQSWLRRRGLEADQARTPLQQGEAVAGAFPRHRAQVMNFVRLLNRALYEPDATVGAEQLDRSWRRVARIPRRARADVKIPAPRD